MFSSTCLDSVPFRQNIGYSCYHISTYEIQENKFFKKIKLKHLNTFIKKIESPVSLKTLNSTEIERLPGANRDASKVIASLPGVASRATFRNDIIIRGGSPGENKFYLDGIEVPNINHFATQGSSGGPVGLLNVNFINEVDFYSGAFPANRANGLSSVLAFKQKDGNEDGLITCAEDQKDSEGRCYEPDDELTGEDNIFLIYLFFNQVHFFMKNVLNIKLFRFWI